MNIGLDACGNFAARSITAGFESSALAATTVPPGARVDISGWTQQRLAAWGREELGELHAAELDWDQRREVCAMLGDRGDLHAAVIVTSNLLLCSEEAVTAHRARQTKLAEASVAAATTDDGHRRGQRVFRLLSGGRLGQSRLNDREYVLAAMVPQAVMYATQRAFCFYAGDEWRPAMRELSLSMDDDTPATVRYVSESLVPVIGGDERFRLVTPQHWRDDPVHPLLARALHPDGDGYRPQELVGEKIAWVRSHDEPAVQVADFAAWVVCRTITRPDEPIARECFELLRPLLAGEGGRCFELYSIGPLRPEDAAVYAHLHSAEQPPQWLLPSNAP